MPTAQEQRQGNSGKRQGGQQRRRVGIRDADHLQATSGAEVIEVGAVLADDVGSPRVDGTLQRDRRGDRAASAPSAGWSRRRGALEGGGAREIGARTSYYDSATPASDASTRPRSRSPGAGRSRRWPCYRRRRLDRRQVSRLSSPQALPSSRAPHSAARYLPRDHDVRAMSDDAIKYGATTQEPAFSALGCVLSARWYPSP